MFGLIPYVHRDIANTFFKSTASVGFRVDVRDEGDHFALEAELPGVRKEDIHVMVENGVLTIEAVATSENGQRAANYVCHERRHGLMRRSFSLEGVREDGITGAYENGVLRLRLPRLAEAVANRREISIA